MNVERVGDQQRLRIAVLGDFDGVHTRSWLRWFIERGHDVHAISFYPPTRPLDGVAVHVLRQRTGTGGAQSSTVGTASGSPWTRGPLRLLHAMRYRRTGLARVVAEIAPDVLHAHFVVEHGFFGATLGFHPYVVTAWGSDILVEPRRDPVSRQIAKWTLRRADLVTSNNAAMARALVALGAPRAKVEKIVLGADAWFGERWSESVNVSQRDHAPVVLSTRAHESLYNIDTVIEAFSRVAANNSTARLVVAHSGSMTETLQKRAAASSARLEFTGTVDATRLRELMTAADVFVSVPSSDGTSVALLQAMSAGAFPIVAGLETQEEWIRDGQTGLLVPPGDAAALAGAIARALSDPDLRRTAAERNRIVVAERGTNETEMAKMEQLYLRLGRRG